MRNRSYFTHGTYKMFEFRSFTTKACAMYWFCFCLSPCLFLFSMSLVKNEVQWQWENASTNDWATKFRHQCCCSKIQQIARLLDFSHASTVWGWQQSAVAFKRSAIHVTILTSSSCCHSLHAVDRATIECVQCDQCTILTVSVLSDEEVWLQCASWQLAMVRCLHCHRAQNNREKYNRQMICHRLRHPLRYQVIYSLHTIMQRLCEAHWFLYKYSKISL